jgi:hypothetical protein
MVDRSGRPEACRSSTITHCKQAAHLQTAAQLARDRDCRINHSDGRPGYVSNDIIEKRIMRASQHDRVGAFVEQGAHILFNERTR